MDWVSALVLMLGMICAFMALGLPVAFAFFLANIVGALIFLGGGSGLVSFVRGSMASISAVRTWLRPISQRRRCAAQFSKTPRVSIRR